jgi:endonuclease/exonuclease/phosphatase family metal-dependent hydrolase
LATADFRIVTYNVHRGRGMDRRVRPERIADVLADIGADVVALQEVIGPGRHGTGHAEEFGAALGMGWIMAPTRELRRHLFGNVILSRFPIRDHAQHDLTWKSSEPRCVQRVEVDLGPLRAQIYNVHLGTALLERRHQAGVLAGYVHERRPSGPKIVLGDFNEWMRRGHRRSGGSGDRRSLNWPSRDVESPDRASDRSADRQIGRSPDRAIGNRQIATSPISDHTSPDHRIADIQLSS